MTTFEHKKYGSVGNEFIVHHCTLQPKRMIVSLVVTTTLSTTFKLYEMDAMVLWMISLLLSAVLLFRLVNKVSKEVLLVLPSLGVQVKTEYWFGGLETQFFDKSLVKGIVINEAITMHSVLSYLAVLLTSSSSGQVEQVYPLFTKSWPCLKDLVYVYRTVENMCPDTWTKSGHVSAFQGKSCEQQGAGDSTQLSQMGSKKQRKSEALAYVKRRTRSSKS